LSPADLHLLAGLLSSDAHWSAPALVGARALDFGHEAAIGAAVAIAAAVALRLAPAEPRRAGERTAQWMMVGFGLAIALPWLAVTDPQGLGFRLRIAAFVPLALNAATVIDPLLSRIIRLARIKQLSLHQRELAAGAVALLFAIRPHAKPTEGLVAVHPALVAAVMASTHQIPPGMTVIVPERHIMYMVAWYTRASVSLKPEPVPREKRMRILPGRFMYADPRLERPTPLSDAVDRARSEPSVAPPIGLHPGHRNGMVLVTEPTWEWLLAQLPPRARDWWGGWPTI
jgi:hypothetical protein